MDRRLGGPLPRQQANPPRTHPRPEAEATFSHVPRRDVGLSGINPSFLGLFRCRGQVIHVLLTRSPLSPGPKPRFSLDLHVLSAPPAFVLSQDQTLREETRRHRPKPLASLFSSSSMLDRHPQRSVQTGSCPHAGTARSRPRERSRRITLLSFQRPSRAVGDKKASDSRGRPSGRNSKRRIRSLEGAPVVE